VQSRNEEASLDFLNRTVYQLRNLRGPLEGVLQEKRDWEKRGHEVIVHQLLGEAMETRLTALPEGAAKWRFIALTLAILDEYSYNTHDKDAYVAALSCVEGGGKIVVIGTSCWGSHMNDEMIVMQDRADLIGEISVSEDVLPQTANYSAEGGGTASQSPG
jgi:hypothetical protein